MRKLSPFGLAVSVIAIVLVCITVWWYLGAADGPLSTSTDRHGGGQHSLEQDRDIGSTAALTQAAAPLTSASDSPPDSGIPKMVKEASKAKPVQMGEHRATELIPTAENHLRSVLGEIARNLDQEERERIMGDTAFRDWMVEIESKLGNELNEEARNQIRARQIQTIDLRDRLQEAYLGGTVDWATYLDGMRSVSLWSDKPYQEMLTEEQYRRLNGFDKSDLEVVTDTVWEPPETIEALNFFPQIRADHPDITLDELYQNISQDQLDELMSMRKAQLYEELRLTADVNRGDIDQDALLGTLQQNEAELAGRARSLLSAEGYQLLFPETVEQGDSGAGGE